MDVHLSLSGKWVPCRAQQRACPRVYHLPSTTPKQVAMVPLPFVEQLLSFQDPPTEIYPEGGMEWRNRKGLIHRRHDLPAVIEANGTKQWYRDGYIHREGDKPAIEYADGGLAWYEWGNRHRRFDLPALVKANGDQAWFIHDRPHRLEGPAFISADGTQTWYWEGYKISKRSHAQLRRKHLEQLSEYIIEAD